MLHLIPSWLVWADVRCMVHVALPKLAINQLKPVQQRRQQEQKAYCPNIYIDFGSKEPKVHWSPNGLPADFCHCHDSTDFTHDVVRKNRAPRSQ